MLAFGHDSERKMEDGQGEGVWGRRRFRFGKMVKSERESGKEEGFSELGKKIEIKPKRFKNFFEILNFRDVSGLTYRRQWRHRDDRRR